MRGIVATPAISDGPRTSSGASPRVVVTQASTKYRGGVISAFVWTVSTTPGRLCSVTIQ